MLVFNIYTRPIFYLSITVWSCEF